MRRPADPLRALHPRFTIPMRGNETTTPEIEAMHREAVGFTIPMRGNEAGVVQPAPATTTTVYDPHEG